MKVLSYPTMIGIFVLVGITFFSLLYGYVQHLKAADYKTKLEFQNEAIKNLQKAAMAAQAKYEVAQKEADVLRRTGLQKAEKYLNAQYEGTCEQIVARGIEQAQEFN